MLRFGNALKDTGICMEIQNYRDLLRWRLKRLLSLSLSLSARTMKSISLHNHQTTRPHPDMAVQPENRLSMVFAIASRCIYTEFYDISGMIEQ
jgi:hypothetical protein